MCVQSGSLKKGTALKDKADLDAVVFLNDFYDKKEDDDDDEEEEEEEEDDDDDDEEEEKEEHDDDDAMKRYIKELPDVLKKMKRAIKKNSNIPAKIEYLTRHALKIKMWTKMGEWFDVDILPAVIITKEAGMF